MIPIAKPCLKGNEQRYLLEAVKSGYVSSKGDFVKQFEKKFAEYIDTRYATTTSSGTTALQLIFEGIGIKGKEVILPTMTFGACVATIIHAGGKPIFVDCGNDWNMDLNEVKKAINNNTKVILVVHLYGKMVDLNRLNDLVGNKKIWFVEDCAESLGCKNDLGKAGSLCDAGAFSFYGNKVLTTGEGGMITTNNKMLIDKINILKNHGMKQRGDYSYSVVGHNFRLTNLQSAVGLAQLEKIGVFLNKREIIKSWYERWLNKKKFSTCLTENGCSVWLYPLVCANKKIKEESIQTLNLNNIEVRSFFEPLTNMLPYKRKKVFKKANSFYERGLLLPCYQELTYKEVKHICRLLNRVDELE